MMSDYDFVVVGGGTAGCVLVRYRDGQWAEHWAVADAVSLLRQTGALG
jgi:pyruvate/2-oxoglutarate dehydrogenase complex dihydrolipoamide dehydrogenase (E3) component